MSKIIISPSKYIQGKGELSNIAKYISILGNSAIVIADEFVSNLVGDIVKSSFDNSDVSFYMELFNGECSKEEINRLRDVISKNNAEVMVGIGGGKTLDTAKAVAYYEKIPVVIVPTIASTDAPCSALSVIYTEEGVFSEYLFLPSNPNIVIMDTQIIANAPPRLLVAGIGDALATYFEAKACTMSNGKTMAGGKATKTALALAELCYETLLEDGLKAKLAVENKVVTKSLENVIEANTYLSGVGFESGGIAAAHAIHNGFTAMEETHHLYHGEKVAFGTLAQLVLENRDYYEIMEIVDFCKSVGLPTTLKDMGITKIDRNKLLEVAKLACAEGETIHNMPFEVTPDDVLGAILIANELGSI